MAASQLPNLDSTHAICHAMPSGLAKRGLTPYGLYVSTTVSKPDTPNGAFVFQKKNVGTVYLLAGRELVFT